MDHAASPTPGPIGSETRVSWASRPKSGHLLDCSLFQPTERSALLTDLLKPKGHCTSRDLHSTGDVSVPLPCDFQGIPPDRFKQWVENLVALSNLDGNGDLRDALWTMWKRDSLQSCVMQAIFITANNQVVTEHELRLAKTYGLTLNKTDEHVGKARKELKKVKRLIDARGEGLSRGPALKRFGLYQRALRDLADATLTAGTSLRVREGARIHQDDRYV